MKYPKDFINKIICGDILDVIKQIPDEKVDLVVTSPPYNLKNSTGNGMKDGRGGKWANAALQKGYSHHDDCMPHDAYVKWQRQCLRQMFRVSRKMERFFIITNGVCKTACCKIEAILSKVFQFDKL